MSAEARARLRATTPAGYRWWWHVALIASFQIAALAGATAMLDGARGIEWAAAAPMLLLVLFGEWASHRYTMHRRVFPRPVYHRHVLEHHAFFTFDDMRIDGAGDLRWVLFPPWALPLLLVAILPLFVLLRWMATPNLAWIFVMVVIAYYALYEIVHVLTHVEPGRGRFGRLHEAISRHHRLHHDPALMKRWNFNFAVPLFDWLFGTRRSG